MSSLNSLSQLPHRLMTMEEFCRKAQIGRTLGYALAREGKIPIVRFGNCIRVLPEALKFNGET